MSTSTNTTTTTGGQNPNCTAYASPAPSAGSNAINVYVGCSLGATASAVAFTFGSPPAPLTSFSAHSGDTCTITSASPGTDNRYGCTGTITFPPGGTRSFGVVFWGATPPPPTYTFEFTAIINGLPVTFTGQGSGGPG